MLQSNPIVNTQKVISPAEMNLAKIKVKEAMDKLASYDTFVELTLYSSDLFSISKLGTHLIPKTRVNISTSNFGVSLSSTTEINFLGTWFLNGRCLLVEENGNSGLDSCQVGSIPISGFIIQKLILGGIRLVIGEDVAQTMGDLLTSTKYSNNNLTIKAKKSKYLKEKVNNSLSAIGSLATLYTRSASASPEVIRLYVYQIEKIYSTELADYIKVLFTLAHERSKNNDAVDENTAIIWALAIQFGDYRFGSLMGIKSKKKNKKIPLLRGRADLTKHFIYSAALQQLGDSDMGLSIGEAKELLDSTSGGSGYSFSDLSADKAGLKFSEFITKNNKNALFSQKILQSISDESDFFPFVHDLAEGFKTDDFKRVIGSTDSDNYKMLEKEVDLRIYNLALFNNSRPFHLADIWSKPNAFNYNFSYKVDTHIHTKYSYGSHTVDEIAQQAFNFGCEAIAITDLGDRNLKRLMSDEYFSELEKAQEKYSYLTIIPGLEWNIPPLQGREHATLILPNSLNLKRNLTVFRDRYDHYKRFDDKVLSPEQALKWLETNGEDNTGISPMLIYNHPSRKNFQLSENEHDFVYWRKYSNLVLGFSGSPGHQKKRDDKNGSYERKIETIDGWDPSIAKIGGEWDRLLQQGYKVWAARSASDFHSTKIDYWPCQFSSTHVMAKTNNHNDIIKGFQRGDYWAQHGNFVKKIDFSVNTPHDNLNMGTEGFVSKGEEVTVELSLKLNDIDWQNNPAKLDELELIMITNNNVESKIFTNIQLTDQVVKISYKYVIDSKFIIFRWRGKNIQPEKHSYMFYTNPIKLRTI